MLARITPCLENGKTAFVDILDDNEVAFGSTEFIVLRAKHKISSPQYVFYLAISPWLRDKSISLMTGTSGRQRVDVNSFSMLQVSVPPLAEQERIAGVLGALDDKIELLRAQNKTLEEMAQAIFKCWFVDFDIVKAKEAGTPKEEIIDTYKISPELYDLFPCTFTDSPLGPIPTGWKVKRLGDISSVTSGKRPPAKMDLVSELFTIPVYGGNGIKWFTNISLFTDPLIITGRVGTLGEVYRIVNPCWVSDNALVFQPDNVSFLFVFQVIRNINFQALIQI